MKTKEERRELLDQHLDMKRMNETNTKAAVLRSACKPTPNAEEGGYNISLNDIETVPLGNSGADYSSLPSELLSLVRCKYPRVAAELLVKQMILDTALKSNELEPPATALRRMKLDLTIVLP